MKFEEYLKLEWKKWKKFIELSKLENEGKEEKNAFVSVPFIFANKNNFVIINEIMRDVILSFFGNECNMLTIIKGKKLSLLEEIKDGYFVDYKWYNDDNVKELKKIIESEGKKVHFYKYVHISLLEGIYKLRKEKDRRRFLIKFVSLMNSAYKEKKLKLWPKNDLINLLRIIQKSVDTHPDLFLEFFPLITNFKITSGKNSAFFDLKSRITVDVDEDASLEMIKKISLCKDMQSIYNTAFNHLMYCLKNNKIHLEDFFAWPVISWLIEKKIVNLEEKTKLSLKLFANPLKVLFVVKTKMILLEFEDGALKSVKQVHSNKIDLKNIWLDLCEKYSFIHFAIRVKKESIKYSRTFVGRLQLLVKPTSIYEFYPKNQFLNELTKKEILDLLLHLAIPFLTD